MSAVRVEWTSFGGVKMSSQVVSFIAGDPLAPYWMTGLWGSFPETQGLGILIGGSSARRHQVRPEIFMRGF